MSRNNYPQSGLNEIEPAAVQATVTCLLDLRNRGKPKSNEDLKKRIDEFFNFCQRSSIRPGIETLALALGISRQTLFKWSRGQNCDKERMEIIQDARALIDGFIEQCVLSGKINPASGIFLMKNWLGYKDSVSIEENVPMSGERRVLTDEDLIKIDLPEVETDMPEIEFDLFV